jgi:tetratricopeptide (TPR) repeat protein
MVLTLVMIAGSAGCVTKVEKADTSGLDAEGHLRQGMTYVSLKDYPNAITEFQTSISMKPTAEAYSNLGTAYLQVGKPNLALDALKKAEAMSPNDSVVLYNLAAAESRSGNTDLALEYLDKALRAGFKHYDAIRFDPDLENLRGEPEFRTVLEKNGVFLQ